MQLTKKNASEIYKVVKEYISACTAAPKMNINNMTRPKKINSISLYG